MKNELILKIGAEGGSLTLFGVRTQQGWLFSREVIDHSLMLLNETAIQHKSEVVCSWDEALTLLDRYPWHKLCPIDVHPEFRKGILERVIARYEADNDTNHRYLHRWEVACGALDNTEKGESNASGRDSACFMDDKGNKSNWELHEQMVAGNDNLVAIKQIRASSKKRGVSQSAIDLLFPLPK